MNGRVYDPTLGRFISADPVIKEGFSSQNFSRYSYVLNAPNKYTDPSGFTQKAVKESLSVKSWGGWNNFNNYISSGTQVPLPVGYGVLVNFKSNDQHTQTAQNASTIFTDIVSPVLGSLASGYGEGTSNFFSSAWGVGRILIERGL